MISFYDVEGGDKTKKVEEYKIYILINQVLSATKKNLVKILFPIIIDSDHKVLSVVNVIHDLTLGIF